MRVLLTALAVILVTIPPANGSGPRTLCQAAAVKAEQEFSIPDGLLQAISLVETGHARDGEVSAWPWTVNLAGTGHYFPTRAAAEAFVKRKNKPSDTSIDVGCFQINTKWHSEAFASYKTMFDPMHGAQYAASFLSQLHDEFGDWNLAVRSYHSRDAEKGGRYGAKVAAALGKIGKPSPAPALRSMANVTSYSSPAAQGGVAISLFTAVQPMFDARPASPLIVERK